MPHLRRLLLNYGRGLLMGAADVIPGVSGGTVALIVGIYERLIHSIKVGVSAVLAAVRLDLATARRRLAEVEWLLVLPLGAGILTALVIGARIIPTLLEDYREPVSAVFFGLILGSAVVPYRRIEHVGRTETVLILLAALAAFVLVGLPPREIADPQLVYVFFSAAIAICAMILPGISGAFILLVLGIYAATLEALRELDVPYVLTFVAGAAIGLGAFSRLLEWLLTHRHSVTMAALTGLMIGALRALWPWQTEERELLGAPDPLSFALMAGMALAGLVVVLLIIRLGNTSRPVMPDHEAR
jgi:putative membrane protein